MSAIDYRFLTPTDVDRFIQVPEVLNVDARNLVLTVEEDTMQKYDNIYKITDYAIYCEVPKAQFFNSGMDWKYKIIQDIDASGNYLGPRVIDAHNPTSPTAVALTADIISATTAKQYLGVTTNATRFVHYKQCNRFFKYSFKVGDAININVNLANATETGVPLLDGSGNQVTRSGQLYAVYLDKTTGAALPYWQTIAGSGADQTAEVRQYFYADASALGSALSTIAAGSQLVSSLDNPITPANVTVVAPPDPEFVETTAAGVIGGNLVIAKDASDNLIIRPVGEQDVSGNWVQYSAENFVDFSTDSNRALVLYWVVEPMTDAPYLGDEMYVAWSSVNFGASPGYIRPLRDFRDASGFPIAPPVQLLEVYKFTVNKDLAANTLVNVEKGIQDFTLSSAAPRLYLPASKFIVQHDKPNEPDVTTNEFDVPFAYEVANTTNFDDTKKSIMGGRIMQVVSQYLFDAASTKELAYFPYFLNESKTLNDKILDALAVLLKTPDVSSYTSRTDILTQIMIKHGRKYFEEYAALNDTTNERIGDVWAVINKINEMFLFFTVTVRTTVSNRTKDDVEVIRLVEVPVVVRIFD